MELAEGDKAKADQELRAKLRKDFLDTLLALRDKPVEIVVYETSSSSLKAIYKTCDDHFNHLIVENIETAIGIVPKVIVRSSDVISLNFNLP